MFSIFFLHKNVLQLVKSLLFLHEIFYDLLLNKKFKYDFFKWFGIFLMFFITFVQTFEQL